MMAYIILKKVKKMKTSSTKQKSVNPQEFLHFINLKYHMTKIYCYNFMKQIY